jgi:hypothetical protein
MTAQYQTLAGRRFELPSDDVTVVAAAYEGTAESDARQADARLQIGKDLEVGGGGFYRCT